jgi:hypothetical protein
MRLGLVMAIELAVSKDDVFRVTEQLEKMLQKHRVIQVALAPLLDSRTQAQNRAIHLYCGMMADRLNDGGFTYAMFIEHLIRHGVNVPWDMDKVKYAWQLIQLAMIGHDKTRKLKTDEVSKVYEVTNERFADLAGVSIPFPDRFNQDN